jgi:acyl-CoA thioester hydrolase
VSPSEMLLGAAGLQRALAVLRPPCQPRWLAGGAARRLSSSPTPPPAAGKSDDLLAYRGHVYAFQTPVEVRWGDQDAMSHVNNAVYFAYFESARIKHFEACGLEVKLSGSGEGQALPILASTSCRYKAPLTYPCEIVVGVALDPAVGESSLTQHLAVFNTKTRRVVADGQADIVFIDYKSGKRCAVPPALLATARAMQETAKATGRPVTG